MKNYRNIVPIVLVVLMALGIYTLIDEAMSKQKDVEEKLTQAEKFIVQELYDKAEDVYSEIILIDNNPKYYISVIDMYYKVNNIGKTEEWGLLAKNEFPENVSVYDRLLRTFIKDEEYDEAYTILEECDARGLTNKNIEKYRNNIEFVYDTRRVGYLDVTAISGNYMGALIKEKWALASASGSNVVGAKFDQVGFFANDLVPVKFEGKWFFMNSSGEFLHNISKGIKGEITEVGLYSNNMYSICVNGKYAYYDLNFKKVFGDYDYAGSFSGGLAAVKKGNTWQIITADGKALTKDKYEDIVVDERGVCCKKERVFVKKNGSYIMLDTAGKQVGKEKFDSAKVFANDDYAAIMNDGLWGFIDTTGKIVLKPKYSDANSFSVGLAPVKHGDKWGYINIQGDFIIDNKFDFCSVFTNKGTSVVKTGDRMDIVKLYKYNYKAGI